MENYKNKITYLETYNIQKTEESERTNYNNKEKEIERISNENIF